jgi:hypothetical protein
MHHVPVLPSPLVTSCVLPGWHTYLGTLKSAMEGASTSDLPAAWRHTWRLPEGESALSIWQLLSSRFIERVLVVGHSLGEKCADRTHDRL